MRRVILVLALGVGIAVPWLVSAQERQQYSYIPARGFVPDSITAVRIAVAVWEPIYGEGQIRKEAPYNAGLKDGVWTVNGTLHCGGRTCVGGVAIAEIAKRDGRILRVIHTQ